MRIAIIEDEKEQREYLYKMVEQWQKDKDPSGTVEAFPSGEVFLFNLPESFFDILLIDIHLTNISGMDLAKKLREEGSEVMITFLTGEREYVFEGYKVQALDYLLKPINKEELCKVLNQALSKIVFAEPQIIIDTGEGIEEVALSKIMYLEVQDHTVYVHILKSGIKASVIYRSRETLGECSSKLKNLSEEEAFVSPHRSFLVHCGFISRITKKAITLHEGSEIPIARGRWDQVYKAYLSYRRRNII